MDITSLSHLSIYMITSVTSYYVALSYHSILSSILLGWGIYGITSIGHDLLHSPTRKNRYLAFFCMDMLLFNSDEWIQVHNKEHHGDLKGENDIMQLKGHNLITEWCNLLEVSKRSSVVYHIWRIPFYILLYPLLWYQIITIYGTVFFCMAYFTYITHSCSVQSRFPVGTIQHNLDHTWDIFPESWSFGLLFGGINAHASHHCFPICNRSEHKTKSRYLAQKYPEHYRCINSFTQLYSLYSNRFIIHPQKED